ncbi:MAG: hypothetical protein ACK5XN_21775 [Bacteroidota bacterium]
MELNELSAVVKQSDSLGRIASALHEIAMECERMAKEVSAPDVRDDLPEDDDDESLEHLAGPMPDPGEGYRVLTKDPPEDLRPEDEYELVPGSWVTSQHARTNRQQLVGFWYRRKIEVAQPPEPPKKWRILEPGEVVQEGDLMNSKLNPPSDPPNGGWLAATSFCFGKEASFYSGVYYARPVADEPAKEPEHPAGPQPDPGEGYRILKKDPPEDLQPGDEYQLAAGHWDESGRAQTNRHQNEILWYRRKIEPPKSAWEPEVGDWVLVTRPKTPEVSDDTPWLSEMDQFDGAVMQAEQLVESCQPVAFILAGTNYAFRVDWLAPAEYRKPVLPADARKACEFSDDGQRWLRGVLDGWLFGRNCWVSSTNNGWKHCRIKKDA